MTSVASPGIVTTPGSVNPGCNLFSVLPQNFADAPKVGRHPVHKIPKQVPKPHLIKAVKAHSVVPCNGVGDSPKPFCASDDKLVVTLDEFYHLLLRELPGSFPVFPRRNFWCVLFLGEHKHQQQLHVSSFLFLDTAPTSNTNI